MKTPFVIDLARSLATLAAHDGDRAAVDFLSAVADFRLTGANEIGMVIAWPGNRAKPDPATGQGNPVLVYAKAA